MAQAEATIGRGWPSWYHGWNVVAICVLTQVAALALTLNSFSLFLKGWTQEFRAPVSTFTLGVSIFSLSVAGVVPFVGAAADRFPARLMLGVALVGLAITHVAIGFASAAWQIMALYAVALPVFIAMASNVQGQALVSRWFSRHVGLAMGLTAFGAALGGVIAPPVIVWLLPHIGWRACWWLYGGMIAIVALPLVLVVARDRPLPGEGDAYVAPVAAVDPKTRLSVRSILSRRNFWVTIGTFLPVQCAYMAVTINLAPFAASRGLEPAVSGGLLAMMAICALAGKFTSGLLADKVGNRPPWVLVSLSSATGMFLLAWCGHSTPLLIAGFLLVGLGGAAWTLLASSTAAEFGGAGFGKAFGLINMLTPICAATPTLVARLEEASGSYAMGLTVIGVLALLGAGLALLLVERQARPAEPRGLAGPSRRTVAPPLKPDARADRTSPGR